VRCEACGFFIALKTTINQAIFAVSAYHEQGIFRLNHGIYQVIRFKKEIIRATFANEDQTL